MRFEPVPNVFLGESRAHRLLECEVHPGGDRANHSPIARRIVTPRARHLPRSVELGILLFIGIVVGTGLNSMLEPSAEHDLQFSFSLAFFLLAVMTAWMLFPPPGSGSAPPDPPPSDMPGQERKHEAGR